jgi:hypothetical protein
VVAASCTLHKVSRTVLVAAGLVTALHSLEVEAIGLS